MIRSALDAISLWAMPVLLVAITLVGILRGVKVYDVFRLTTQQDFEANRTFGYPGNFISITKGGDLDILSKRSGLPQTVAEEYASVRNDPSLATGQPVGGLTPGV